VGRLSRHLLARSVRSAVCQLAKRFIEIYTKTYGRANITWPMLSTRWCRPLPRTERRGQGQYGDSTANSAANSAATRAAALPPPCATRAWPPMASGSILDHRRRAQGDMGDAGLAVRRGQGVLDARGDPRVPVPRAR
jgi:hypothetical protein